MTDPTYLQLTGNQRSTKTFEEFLAEWKQQDVWVHALFDRVNKLESKVYELEAPKRYQAVIDFLHNSGKPREEHSITRHTGASWTDLNVMVKQKMIFRFKHVNSTVYSTSEVDVPVQPLSCAQTHREEPKK